MRRTTFDPDVLRSFVLGAELGSFAKAAERLNRSTSAVSAQLKRLEEQTGKPLVHKVGRGLALTEQGELMLSYARRLLEINDEAAAAMCGETLEGRIRLGLQEDFGERLLPGVLARFSRAHPNLQIAVRVASNGQMKEDIARGRLDLALAWQGEGEALDGELLTRVPMAWIGPSAADGPIPHAAPLPLVVLEGPCLLRQAALDALDRAGISWRIAFSSASLAATWAAISAGLGIGLRTPLCLPPSVRVLEASAVGLPALPPLGLSLYYAEAAPSLAVTRLAEIIRQHMEVLPAARS
ncbi:LysR substrate-binding domain-containing protein [Salinicola endophyticus]|uniref:LysR substrate-binding domain-containing protein n=1 Tax=Salinicola endophyticus TaxID=1949083 RepID=UPI000DA21647|nr:LysR substrate-binding domain-containing protein [Salinicola endophyticus]